MRREFPGILFIVAVVAFWFWQQDHREDVMRDCLMDGVSQRKCNEESYWRFDADDGSGDSYGR